jgi:hypothetical protein
MSKKFKQDKLHVQGCFKLYRLGGAAIPLQPWTGREGSGFQDSWHMKTVSLSALHIGRVYPPGNIPDTPFCWRLSQLQGHSAAGRIMSLINSIDTIGNRTRVLSTFSAMPQPTAPPTVADGYTPKHFTPSESGDLTFRETFQRMYVLYRRIGLEPTCGGQVGHLAHWL